MLASSLKKVNATRSFALASLLILVVYFLPKGNETIFEINDSSENKQQNQLIRDSKQKSCEPNSHSVCFIGKRFCHPGYTGDDCSQKLVPPNPWYSEGCPNLKQDITFDINMPLEMFYTKDNCSSKEISGITGCANLCFSHPVSGVPQIPLAFWKQVQANEASVWKGMGGGNDRIQEHLEGFDNYKSLPSKYFKHF